ncbi:hypothetical protein JK358_25240 [Nocardia sp. 2]|uniref:Membrane protein YmcC n=2 Tax=Nocardia acididurans TaxID=2802282 RepID=A0ABS1MAW7_9NOCA|nr:hypothetical protein [Nocardia acididurans]
MEGFFELLRTNPITALIAATEVGFWILLGAGLLVRYLFKWRRVSTVLLISTPLLDVALLIATVFDLGRGGTATAAHGLGAAYLGFSVAFGHSVIRWADERVAHRFAGGPPPTKPPGRNDPGRLAYEWREWRKCLLAWAIACGTMLLLVFVVGSPDRTEALWYWMSRLTTVLLIWLAVGPIWALFTPADKSEKSEEPSIEVR